MSVNGMKILVTGASSGIGAHIVQFLAGAGAEVVAAARRLEQLEELAAGSDRIHPLRMDVTDAASVAEGTARAAEMMGGLNGLFANAGISRGVPAIKMSDQDWDDQIEINLNGVFRCCRAVIRTSVSRVCSQTRSHRGKWSGPWLVCGRQSQASLETLVSI